MADTQRIENTQEMAPRARARGHLSLVEWPADAPSAYTPKLTAPARRAPVDRLYEGGIILLMCASALAALASFARL